MLMHISRGITYVSEGDFARAISDFDYAIQLNPGSANAYDNRGIAYTNQEKIINALADFKKAREFCSGDDTLCALAQDMISEARRKVALNIKTTHTNQTPWNDYSPLYDNGFY